MSCFYFYSASKITVRERKKTVVVIIMAKEVGSYKHAQADFIVNIFDLTSRIYIYI